MNKRHRLWEMLPPWKLARLDPHETVLLGLSGGADSRALLHLLSVFARRDGFSVVVAHVNHGIRDAEADRDAVFCKELALSYGWEWRCMEADVPALAEQHRRSLELEAREVRYAFFRQIMQEKNIRILVTAHHADDNLETVLFRMCRGTGLHGLAGISPVRPFSSGVLVRPLLPFSRKEILDFCKAEQLEFVTDSTNFQADCSRNRIRLETVPTLEKQFPTLQNSIYRMTRILSDDQDCLDGEATAFLARHLQNGGVSVEALKSVHPAIRRRVIGKMFPRMAEYVHLESVDALLEKGVSGSSVSLPHHLCACLQNGRLLALPDLRRASGYEAFPCNTGMFRLCDGKLTVSVKTYEKCESISDVHNVYTSSCIMVKGTVEKGLQFRSRREGDTVRRNGIRRQVRRLYREAGVPTAVRDALPLLCLGDEILWIPFVGYADGVSTECAKSGDRLITVSISSPTDCETERTLEK